MHRGASGVSRPSSHSSDVPFTNVSLSSTPGGLLWCVEAQLRKDLMPEERATLDGRYAFIQLGSTKKLHPQQDGHRPHPPHMAWYGRRQGRRAVHHRQGRGDVSRLYHIQKQERIAYRQFRRYPGDWHLLLHMAKALLKRYWGAGEAFVAKDLGTDNNKSSKGSNYRRAHHHLVVMWEAIMSSCWKMYLPPGEDMPAEDADSIVVAWIKKRAAERKTFALWEHFLLHDFPAYMTFRTALRTGDFMLRLDALRRIAPIFYITGKD
ncbi:unnamed protein product, partial [Ectocarpus sp. 4 AP-2014]